MYALRDTLLLVLSIIRWTILIHFLMSWLISFQVLNIRQPLVAQAWDALNRLLQPVYRQIRRFVPTEVKHAEATFVGRQLKKIMGFERGFGVSTLELRVGNLIRRVGSQSKTPTS